MIESDGIALVNAIISSPEDDAPRLIYADWLDENNHPDRASYIREMVANPTHNDIRDTSELPWIHERFFISDKVDAFEWNRGFINKVRCRHDNWLANGPHYVRRHPIQHVHFTDVRPVIDAGSLEPEWWLTPAVNKYVDSDFDMRFIRDHNDVKMSIGVMYIQFDNPVNATEWLSNIAIWWAKNESY